MTDVCVRETPRLSELSVIVSVCLFEEDSVTLPSKVSFSSWVAIRKERSAVNDEHYR